MQIAYQQSQITFRQLSGKEGLSQNSAISITQDSTGFLWIASQDGLNKYDGRQFKIYPFSFDDITRSNSSNLGKIYTDRQGDLWILPAGRSPHKLNRTSDKFEAVSDLNDASIVFQDDAFNVWIGTYSNGLFLYDKKNKSTTQILPPSQIKGTIYKIVQSENGKLLIATDGNLLELDTGTNTLFPINPKTDQGETIHANFSAIATDDRSRQWIGTFGNGLFFKEDNEGAFHRISKLHFTDALPLDLNILDLLVDRKGRLWIATYGRGLFLVDFDQQSISNFINEKHNPTSLDYNDILCMYEDYSGTLWFGTDGAGVSYYDEYLQKFNSLTNYQTPENINIDVVRSIAVDKKNAIWIGTSGKGLTQYEPETNSWRTFNAIPGNENTIASDRIMSLLVDEGNNLWIGTQGEGLSIYDSLGNFAHFTSKTTIALSAKTIWSIFQDSRKRFWLGTRQHGLIQFDEEKGELKKYVHAPGNDNTLPSNNIRVVVQDDTGTLWIGSEDDGIASLDLENEKLKQYRHSPEKNSISSNNIKSIYAAPNDIVWIGTNGGGLNALDVNKDQFYTYTAKEGLANDVIYAILPDTQGNLWLSSNKGITKFSPGNTLKDAPTIINYNNYDGLATEFNTGAYYKDKAGNLYFGGLDGFYWFKPDELKDNIVLPKTTITSFEVSNETYPLIDGIRLKHDQNTVSFTFSSLQYSLPEKNLYQYKLSNYDDDWVFAGNNNLARYAYLTPGNYEFLVKSSNYDGVWNNIPVRFNFTITPPWYQTFFAKCMYVIVLMTSIYSTYYYLKWRWRMKLELKLNEEEANRLQRLNDFKSKLYTDISHEFRTPLTLISGPVEAKLSDGGLSEKDFADFSMIKRNTYRLLALVDQLLQLSKLEKGNLKLKLTQGNLGHFLNMLANAFEYKAEFKRIDFKVEIPAIEDAWYDEDALEKIVTNLLSNAFKYCPEGGICNFTVVEKDKTARISVTNSIEERTDIDLDKLFTRFYQEDEYAEGAGVGLSLVKELVALYHGEVTVQKVAGHMIHFQVNVPIDDGYFESVPNTLSTSENQKTQGQRIADPIEKKLEEDPIQHNDGELPILLIVEDNNEVRAFIKSILTDKYVIYEAPNGKVGIEKALKFVPDLIITDVRMPICNGIELCNTLKNDERTSHIPIILLTAHMGEENELEGLRSGADDFITKPFKTKILEKRVQNLINTRNTLRTRYSQELVLTAKDIAITPTDAVFLNKLQKTLDEYLSDPSCNVVFLCKKMGMSRMQLHRKLLAFTGLSTTAFIRSQRLKQAVHILSTSDASISEVAYAVGFNTPSYFIKCFKEVYKTTPSEFIQTTD